MQRLSPQHVSATSHLLFALTSIHSVRSALLAFVLFHQQQGFPTSHSLELLRPALPIIDLLGLENSVFTAGPLGTMPITRSGILEVCAAVARSHGKDGEVIALAITRINLDELFEPARDASPQRRKYIYRKSVKGHDYVYFRMPSGRLVRLPEDENSVEFRKSYERWRSKVEMRKFKTKRRVGKGL